MGRAKGALGAVAYFIAFCVVVGVGGYVVAVAADFLARNAARIVACV